MSNYKYIGPGWRAQLGVLEWLTEELVGTLGQRWVEALDATFPPTLGWGRGGLTEEYIQGAIARAKAEAEDFRLSAQPLPPAGWQPIETAPIHTDVLVTGESGYRAPYDRFVINAHLDPPYRGDRWLDSTHTCRIVDGCRLTGCRSRSRRHERASPL
jgi:hypothetical protein